MLRYLTTGPRWFGLNPIPCTRRINWELFAIVEGSCGMVLQENGPVEVQGPWFWIFPPDTPHGWRIGKQEKCQVIIFHFSHVPPALETFVRRQGRHGFALRAEERRIVSSLFEQLQPHWTAPGPMASLFFQRALIDLSLMILESVPKEQLPRMDDAARHSVEAALGWFSANLADNPTLERAAKAVHVSPAHLRRQFHEVRRESPNAAFTRLRMLRAEEMLEDSEIKLEAVAAACGFSSASAFCRAFKRHYGRSPSEWKGTYRPNHSRQE